MPHFFDGPASTSSKNALAYPQRRGRIDHGGRDALHAHFPDAGRINHSQAYSDDGCNTNQAKSFFAQLRRMVSRQHHFVSARYLDQYANEAARKEDHRRLDNGKAFARILRLTMVSGKSVSFRGYWQRHRMPQGVK